MSKSRGIVIIKAIAKVEITIEKGSLFLSRIKNKIKRVKPGNMVMAKALK